MDIALFPSKIVCCRKLELFDKYLLESSDIVLLVKEQHRHILKYPFGTTIAVLSQNTGHGMRHLFRFNAKYVPNNSTKRIIYGSGDLP